MKIKQNTDDGWTELWDRGEFIASWTQIEIPDASMPILNAMLREAVSHGKRSKLKEIKKVLGT